MAKLKFDLIVVGAGPAGLTAAHVAATAGLNVIVFERGENPGSKNMMGGILFTRELNEIIPEFWKEAPLERPISEMGYWLMTAQSGVKFSYRDSAFLKEPYNAFSTLRAKFDKWYGEKVEEAGALLVRETLVESCIQKDGKVVGVKTGRADGDVYADCVIIADGVNSLLGRDLGLHREWPADNVALGVKELITLPKETVEDRFGLAGDEGVAIQMLGAITRGLTGGGFIYSNHDSVSLGVVVLIEELTCEGLCPADMMEEVKAHPLIAPLIAGGETKEYTAHMVPEGGYRAIPQLFTDGALIVGDAAMLVNTTRGEGTNLAIASGKMAGETVVEARKRKDFSAGSLSLYERKMKDSFVLKDLKKYQDTYHYLHENRALLSTYPELVSQVMRDAFTADGIPKADKLKELKRNVKAKRSYFQIGKDMFRGWRSLK